MGTAGLAGRAALDISVVRSLSARSDVQGLLRFGVHLLVMAGTGALIWWAQPYWYLLIPAMLVHGFTLVSMFAPMHECVHRTAFNTRILNEIFGWIAGVLSVYNFTYYRHYHTWHHRYTQNPEKDPELMSPKPRTVLQYAIEITGIPFWVKRPLLFLELALGRTGRYPFIPARSRGAIALSAAVQSAIYAAGIASIVMGYHWALYYFFLPLLLAQPLLRLMLIVEHTGCTQDENGLTNTRTTLTLFPIRLLMWNMPFHGEHHLYPSIPFYVLPRAHQHLKEKITHISPGYATANREVVGSLHNEPQGEPT